MEIVWLGHSSVRLRSEGLALVTDPYADSLGLSMARQRAAVVTVSNTHPHHSYCEAIEGDPRIARGPGEWQVGAFYLRGIGTPGLAGEPAGDREDDRRVNTVFVIRAEGITLCHLGDLSRTLSPAEVEGLGQTDVLFVPAGGGCTIGPAQAAELVNLIGPRIVVPLHYRAEGVEVALEPLDAFLSQLGITEAVPQGRLNVTASTLTRELRVVVLQRGR